MINKRMFNINNDKKLLHKVGKQWVTVSTLLLALIGGGAVASKTVSHADTTNNNNQVNPHFKSTNTTVNANKNNNYVQVKTVNNPTNFINTQAHQLHSSLINHSAQDSLAQSHNTNELPINNVKHTAKYPNQPHTDNIIPSDKDNHKLNIQKPKMLLDVASKQSNLASPAQKQYTDTINLKYNGGSIKTFTSRNNTSVLTKWLQQTQNKPYYIFNGNSGQYYINGRNSDANNSDSSKSDTTLSDAANHINQYLQSNQPKNFTETINVDKLGTIYASLGTVQDGKFTAIRPSDSSEKQSDIFLRINSDPSVLVQGKPVISDRGLVNKSSDITHSSYTIGNKIRDFIPRGYSKSDYTIYNKSLVKPNFTRDSDGIISDDANPQFMNNPYTIDIALKKVNYIAYSYNGHIVRNIYQSTGNSDNIDSHINNVMLKWPKYKLTKHLKKVLHFPRKYYIESNEINHFYKIFSKLTNSTHNFGSIHYIIPITKTTKMGKIDVEFVQALPNGTNKILNPNRNGLLADDKPLHLRGKIISDDGVIGQPYDSTSTAYDFDTILSPFMPKGYTTKKINGTSLNNQYNLIPDIIDKSSHLPFESDGLGNQTLDYMPTSSSVIKIGVVPATTNTINYYTLDNPFTPVKSILLTGIKNTRDTETSDFITNFKNILNHTKPLQDPDFSTLAEFPTGYTILPSHFQDILNSFNQNKNHQPYTMFGQKSVSLIVPVSKISQTASINFIAQKHQKLLNHLLISDMVRGSDFYEGPWQQYSRTYYNYVPNQYKLVRGNYDNNSRSINLIVAKPSTQQSTITINYVADMGKGQANPIINSTKTYGTVKSPFDITPYLSQIPSGYEYKRTNSVDKYTKNNQNVYIYLTERKPPRLTISTITINYMDGNKVIASKQLSRPVSTNFDIGGYLSNLPAGYEYNGIKGDVDHFDYNNHTIIINMIKPITPNTPTSPTNNKSTSNSSSATTPSSATSSDSTVPSSQSSSASSNLPEPNLPSSATPSSASSSSTSSAQSSQPIPVPKSSSTSTPSNSGSNRSSASSRIPKHSAQNRAKIVNKKQSQYIKNRANHSVRYNQLNHSFRPFPIKSINVHNQNKQNQKKQQKLPQTSEAPDNFLALMTLVSIIDGLMFAYACKHRYV